MRDGSGVEGPGEELGEEGDSFDAKVFKVGNCETIWADGVGVFGLTDGSKDVNWGDGIKIGVSWERVRLPDGAMEAAF